MIESRKQAFGAIQVSQLVYVVGRAIASCLVSEPALSAAPADITRTRLPCRPGAGGAPDEEVDAGGGGAVEGEQRRRHHGRRRQREGQECQHRAEGVRLQAAARNRSDSDSGQVRLGSVERLGIRVTGHYVLSVLGPHHRPAIPVFEGSPERTHTRIPSRTSFQQQYTLFALSSPT